MRDYRPLVYKSDQGELKTLGQWIDFANRNGAMFATDSDEYKIRIVVGGVIQGKVLRELTEYKIFNEVKHVPVHHSINS
jgi:hypothetical protein